MLPSQGLGSLLLRPTAHAETRGLGLPHPAGARNPYTAVCTVPASRRAAGTASLDHRLSGVPGAGLNAPTHPEWFACPTPQVGAVIVPLCWRGLKHREVK